jgi:precorrin-4/cobalt-precorrin-4 C11-methyltransferase
MTPPLRTPATVTFVGAGPGDPELLTIGGRKAIRQAGMVLYAGSLVPKAVIACARKGTRIIDSAPLTLEECHALIREAALAGTAVARVHTGDPSLYGALREQADLLTAEGIPWRVIPGITAASAAAAAAGIAFTQPEMTQTLVISRMEGRTPIPERERLRLLAAHGTSMAVYLSGHHAQALQEELAAALPGDTPVLCAHRIGWTEERLVWTSVGELATAVEKWGIQRQTVFLVLPAHGAKGTRSRLYDPAFPHAFRPAADQAKQPPAPTPDRPRSDRG